MIYPAVGKLLEKTGTRYSLVILTSKRARQLGADKDNPMAGRFDEALLQAIDEINEGKIRTINYVAHESKEY